MIQNTISAIKNANTVFFDSSADRKPDISETTMDIAIQAINEEMSKSKELTKWPCLSFRDIDKDSSNGLPLKASKLAADCNSKYVKCTVPYDLRGG